MPRVSKKQAEQNHAEVIAAASKLFRAKGINGVSVPALMAEAGLTHGAFYGHFGSKEELAAAACTHAIEQSGAIYDGLLERHGGDQTAALTEFVKRYTSRCIAISRALDVLLRPSLTTRRAKSSKGRCAKPSPPGLSA